MRAPEIRLFPFSPHQHPVSRRFAGGVALVEDVQGEDITIEANIESRLGCRSNKIPVPDLNRFSCRVTEGGCRLEG